MPCPPGDKWPSATEKATLWRIRNKAKQSAVITPTQRQDVIRLTGECEKRHCEACATCSTPYDKAKHIGFVNSAESNADDDTASGWNACVSDLMHGGGGGGTVL